MENKTITKKKNTTKSEKDLFERRGESEGERKGDERREERRKHARFLSSYLGQT